MVAAVLPTILPDAAWDITPHDAHAVRLGEGSFHLVPMDLAVGPQAGLVFLSDPVQMPVLM